MRENDEDYILAILIRIRVCRRLPGQAVADGKHRINPRATEYKSE
ncbi:hypothetical protein WG66_014043 [Moniliophthora roreri]|nr:hypothetical protein WG66_014043 [Moniliophthora roreri]